MNRHSWQAAKFITGDPYQGRPAGGWRCQKCGMLKRTLITGAKYEGCWWKGPTDERWWFQRRLPLCIGVHTKQLVQSEKVPF